MYNIMHIAHHVTKITCYNLYSMCLCPMKVGHFNKIDVRKLTGERRALDDELRQQRDTHMLSFVMGQHWYAHGCKLWIMDKMSYVDRNV